MAVLVALLRTSNRGAALPLSTILDRTRSFGSGSDERNLILNLVVTTFCPSRVSATVKFLRQALFLDSFAIR